MSTQQFRELQPVDLWSKTLILDKEYSEFAKIVADTSLELHQSIAGFVTRDHDSGNVKSFTRTRYPRRKYGIADTKTLDETTAHLGIELGSVKGVIDRVTYEDMFRVVLGLVEGYSHETPIHSLSEVRSALGTSSLKAFSAEVFSVRPHEDIDKAVYTEPCAIISGDPSDMKYVYNLADAFHQERFTVEDFTLNKAYVVETAYCSSPDEQ